MPNYKASTIVLEKNLPIQDHDEWSSQFRWIVDSLAAFKRVFQPYLKKQTG